MVRALGLLLAAVATAWGGVIAQRIASRSADTSADLSWVQELRAEIRDLKDRVAALEHEGRVKDRLVWVLGDFLDALSAFVLYGRQGPYPSPPEEAAEYFHRGRWVEIKALHDKGRT